MDSPGFFDSKGEEEDKKIYKAIENIFSVKHPQVIFVCFFFSIPFDGNIFKALKMVKTLATNKSEIIVVFTFSANMSVQCPENLKPKLSKYKSDREVVPRWKVLRDDYQERMSE